MISDDYSIQNNYIYGPNQDGKFWIINDFIKRPKNQDPPWLG